jgi:hypothetical protein
MIFKKFTARVLKETESVNTGARPYYNVLQRDLTAAWNTSNFGIQVTHDYIYFFKQIMSHVHQFDPSVCFLCLTTVQSKFLL